MLRWCADFGTVVSLTLQQRFKAFGRPLTVASLAALCIGGGYGLGLHDATNPGPVRPAAPAPANVSAADQRAFSVVWETLSELQRDYYRPDQLDPQKLAQGAAKGMVDAVGDPYTSLLDRQQGELTAAELHGSFDGVGVELDKRDGQYTVVAPVADSPAERAGLRAGDFIVAVDGQAIGALSFDEVARRIRGPRGSSVALSISRDSQTLDFSVVRDTIKVGSVRSRLLSGDMPLAYVRISTFGELTSQQLTEQLGSLLGQGAKGVVLDLRGNPGGYLSSAVDVTSAFLKDGVVLYQQRGGSDTSRRAYRTSGSPQAPDLPVAVLVDRGSASAAEIVAAALQDNQRAVLVGEKTFGKGTVQELHTLSGDAQLRLTVAQWLTPNGHAIQGEGLQPDLEIAPVTGQDAPLEAAVQHLRESGATRGQS